MMYYVLKNKIYESRFHLILLKIWSKNNFRLRPRRMETFEANEIRRFMKILNVAPLGAYAQNSLL